MRTTEALSLLGRVALKRAGEGHGVFPLEPRGKKPLTEHGLRDASTDPDVVGTWWTRWPDANLGMLTGLRREGGRPGLVVLDVDGDIGRASIDALETEHGPLPETLTVSTGNGEHRYFYMPSEVTIRNSTGKLGVGLDVRGKGGYVVVPPSTHANGEQYKFMNAHTPVADMPPWLVERLVDGPRQSRPMATAHPFVDGESTPYGLAAVKREAETVRHTQKGTRNDSLNRAAFNLGQLVAGGQISELLVRDALEDAAVTCGLPDDEARKTIRSGLAAGIQAPRTALDHGRPGIAHGADAPIGSANGHGSTALNTSCTVPQRAHETSILRHRLTDYGNAERLIARHGRDLRYCRPWGIWLVYDGRRWTPDDTGEAERRAKEAARSIYAEAAACENDSDRQALGKHARASESDARIRAMLNLAATEPGIPVRPSELDADPWLLNAANGTIDLRTGTRRPHDPADLVTKLAPVPYDRDAACPVWLAFLERIFAADAELIRFMQRLTGASLVGKVTHHVLPILHGAGSNGKTTMLEVLRHVLGDYAWAADAELLMASRRAAGTPTPELADLHGRRLVTATETSRGRALNVGLVKQLTGGDEINARHLHRNPFTFRPSHTLFLATNHRPTIPDDGPAVWRRVLLVPFAVTIPKAEQDGELPDKLRAEASGILAWLVEGCLAYQQSGLEPPAAVASATDEYREAEDTLGLFLTDRCELRPDGETSPSDLYGAYREWAEAAGEKPLPQKGVNAQLMERAGGLGIRKRRTNSRRFWAGIVLRGPGER